MAAQTPSQTYSTKDTNLIRLSCIYQKLATKVLRYVFQNGTSRRPWNMPLLDYYASEGITIYTFRNRLSDKQKRKVDEDFQGITYDITLLYKCLRYGVHGLAKEKDEKWDTENKFSIESLITVVKNKRDNLAREQLEYTNLQLLNEAKDLKEILIEILKYSGRLFNIPPATIDQEILDVEDDVTKYLYDEFQPTTFEEYKNQLFFNAQTEFFNDKGVKDTMKQYEMSMEDEVSPTNHLVDLKLPVGDVYTEMKLKGKSQSGHDKPTKYEDVLKNDSLKRNEFVTVVSGPAGVGKTTFTKKMISDFKLDISTIKELIDHDHLLKADCRDTTIKSFIELLHHRMPNVSKCFKTGDLEKVALAQKLLVILDGLDELNKASSQLFEELLYLTKKFGITLVITTRPEKMEDIEQKLKYHNLRMRHIELLGVPKEKRDELVMKYHCEISKICSNIQDISGLLKYLKDTELRLEVLWRLPYNLILLTIIWCYDFKDVTSINTAPELYREILQLYRARLKERLQSNESTRHLNGAQLDKIIDFFLYSLARESFIGLINNHINLPQEAYERLEEVCWYLKIPAEEMVSAFLKRIPSADIIYGFPHKGLQDYLAAYYIWLEITGRDHDHNIQDILEGETEFLLMKNVSPNVIRNTVRFLKEELKKKPPQRGKIARTAAGTLGHLFPSLRASSFIHCLLNDIHGSSSYDLQKFQNMFICLLGMFYSEDDVINEDIKLETLMLLQGTGIRDRDAWITILNSVKCDECVATFISKQPKILDGQIKITDSSVTAYVSLMKAIKSPLKNASKVKVDIDIKGDLSDAHELLQLISFHQFKIMRILINRNNSQEYDAMLRALTTPLQDASDVKVDMTDIELLVNIELMNLIEKNNFTVRTLQVQDFEIDDSSLREYISVFKSLPRILERANQVGVDINIKGDLTDAEELLPDLMSNKQFRVKSISIYKNNFIRYIVVMERLATPINDAHDVKIDICGIEDLLDTRKLMSLIEKNDFTVRTLQVQDFEINDANLRQFIPVFKSLPRLQENANQTCVDINIKRDLSGGEELLGLITNCQFKVTRLLINEVNFKTYTTMLETLTKPFKDAHELKVDICIDEDITTIKELMRELKKQNFAIGKLKLKDTKISNENFKEYAALLKDLPTSLKDAYKQVLVDHIRDKGIEIKTLQKNHEALEINEDNISVYTEALTSLPTLGEEEYKGKIKIHIKRETSYLNAILDEIARNMFAVFISLDDNFRHPESNSTASEEALNKVFKRCLVDRYVGRMTPRLSMPVSLKNLWLSVPNTPSYLHLQRFLETDHQLSYLELSINLEVEAQQLSPLPGNLTLPPSLFLADIRTMECIRKASKIAKRLNPINGDKEFGYIYFPRLRLKGENIKNLISAMKGVGIKDSIFLPSSCRPSSRETEENLQQFSKKSLQVREIKWGKGDKGKVGLIFDMDSW